MGFQLQFVQIAVLSRRSCFRLQKKRPRPSGNTGSRWPGQPAADRWTRPHAASFCLGEPCQHAWRPLGFPLKPAHNGYPEKQATSRPIDSTPPWGNRSAVTISRLRVTGSHVEGPPFPSMALCRSTSSMGTRTHVSRNGETYVLSCSPHETN